MGKRITLAREDFKEKTNLSVEEAVALVKKFDGEFPKKYFKEFLAYIDITEDTFFKTIDRN